MSPSQKHEILIYVVYLQHGLYLKNNPITSIYSLCLRLVQMEQGQ